MIEFLRLHLLESVAIFIALLALFVSISSKFYAEKAFSLSLFDKRYKLYFDFKALVNKLKQFEADVNCLPEHLLQVKFLLLEAQYVFGDDVCNLLEDIKEHINGTISYYRVAADMADGRVREDIDVVHRFKVEHYDLLKALPNVLLGDDESLNLNFYFHKYLVDPDFKKPLPATFFQCCRKKAKGVFNCK